MIVIEAATADHAWRQAVRLLRSEGQIQPGRDQQTLELIHVVFSISHPRQRLIFARPFNPAFAIAEIIWILSGGNAVDFPISWNPRMSRFVDSGSKEFHGAYGDRLGSRPKLSVNAEQIFRLPKANESLRLDQLRSAYDALLVAPESRQIVLQIWDSNRDMPGPDSRSLDVPCNLMSHLMVRNGCLEWLQVMRSNDIIWGTPYNFVQFTILQEIMAGWLDVDVGCYIHVSDSLHAYQRHWKKLENVRVDQEVELWTNTSDLRISGYEEWEKTWEYVADAGVRITNAKEPSEALAILDQNLHLPAGYFEWIALLAAESLRKQGYDKQAESVIDKAGEYWAASWRQWHQRQLRRMGSNVTENRD